MATKNELVEAIESIYEAQESADGSRLGMQDALDEIRQFCIEAIPTLEEVESDDDGASDDEDEADNDE